MNSSIIFVEGGMVKGSKNSLLVGIAIMTVLFLLLPINSFAESIDNGWEIDYKSTRIFAQIDEDGKTHIDFVGTLSNYGNKDASEVKIDVKILNDGVIPFESNGGSDQLAYYGTKAVYTIEDFKVGETKDWIIRSEITDIENVDVIDYQIKIFVKTNPDEGFDIIYEMDKSVEVVIADTDKDGLNDIYEQQIGTDINNPDTDEDGYTDFEEVNAGTDPLDKKSNSDKKWSEIFFEHISLDAIGLFGINSILLGILSWYLGKSIATDNDEIGFLSLLLIFLVLVGGPFVELPKLESYIEVMFVMFIPLVLSIITYSLSKILYW